MIVSERWQQEVAETVFEAINSDTDRRKRCNTDEENHTGELTGQYVTLLYPLLFVTLSYFYTDYILVSDGQTDCIVEGEVQKLGNSFLSTWQRYHLKLYPNRLEFYAKKSDGQINKKSAPEVGTGDTLLLQYFPLSLCPSLSSPICFTASCPSTVHDLLSASMESY